MAEKEESGKGTERSVPPPVVTETFSGIGAWLKELGDDLERLLAAVRKDGLKIGLGAFLFTRRGRRVVKAGLTAGRDLAVEGVRTLVDPKSEVGQAFHWGRGGLMQARWRTQQAIRDVQARITNYQRQPWLDRVFSIWRPW